MLNHLIVVMAIATAMRTGIIMNFSMSDYESGCKLQAENDSKCIFTVAKHKTSSTHGSVVFSLTLEQTQLLEGYIEIRSRVEIPNKSHFVFISTTGGQLLHSNVSYSLTKAFHGTYAKRVNCTKLRKAIVTVIHQNHPESKSLIAFHMLHDERTASQYYRSFDKRENSKKCSDIIGKALGTDAVEYSAISKTEHHSVEFNEPSSLETNMTAAAPVNTDDVAPVNTGEAVFTGAAVNTGAAVFTGALVNTADTGEQMMHDTGGPNRPLGGEDDSSEDDDEPHLAWQEASGGGPDSDGSEYGNMT